MIRFCSTALLMVDGSSLYRTRPRKVERSSPWVARISSWGEQAPVCSCTDDATRRLKCFSFIQEAPFGVKRTLARGLSQKESTDLMKIRSQRLNGSSLKKRAFNLTSRPSL